jgi:hypothetical protein
LTTAGQEGYLSHEERHQMMAFDPMRSLLGKHVEELAPLYTNQSTGFEPSILNMPLKMADTPDA